MNLYRISQDVNNGYDTYDSAVVAAKNEAAAKETHPNGGRWQGTDSGAWCTWAYDLDDVKVELIGTAVPGTEPGVIVASFNAG